VSSHSGVRGGVPAETILVLSEGARTALVAIPVAHFAFFPANVEAESSSVWM